MLSKRMKRVGWIACMGTFVLTGCVLREEKIKIARDGSVTIQLEVSGKPEEVFSADAMPSNQSGWNVRQRKVMDNGEEKIVLEAQRLFPPGAELPSSFAAADDPDRDNYLGFPTDVRIERHPDGVYYYFARRYTPRWWARTNYWEEVFFDEDVRNLGQKPVGELSLVDQRKIIRAFVSVEAARQLEFARMAWEQTLPDLSVEQRLIARQALLRVYEQYRLLAEDDSGVGFAKELPAPVGGEPERSADDIDAIIGRCVGQEDESECYDQVAARITGEAYDAYLGSLRNIAGFDANLLGEFERHYQRARHHQDITNEVAGQYFEIEVTLPGEIVGHNGAEVDKDSETNSAVVTWRFDGRAFRDRTHELLAVSRVVSRGRGRR